jgi:hypothetical protein
MFELDVTATTYHFFPPEKSKLALQIHEELNSERFFSIHALSLYAAVSVREEIFEHLRRVARGGLSLPYNRRPEIFEIKTTTFINEVFRNNPEIALVVQNSLYNCAFIIGSTKIYIPVEEEVLA